MGDEQRDFHNGFSRTREQTEFSRKLKHGVSRTEKRLWPRLRSGQMGASFRRQHPVGPYFADYCCVPLRLVVEVDGAGHSLARDAARDARMRELGFDVLRFSAQEMDENLDGVVETIHREVGLRLLALKASQR